MLNEPEKRLIAAIQNGFPLCSRPFQAIGQTLGIPEAEVLAGLKELQARGVIKRVGIVVHHHALGYQANAMVVWDLPNAVVQAVAAHIHTFDFVSLCYVRRRCGVEWPYNFYCMIHGQKREETLQHAEQLTDACGLTPFSRQILFSRRRFKQYGARYFNPNPSA